MTFLEPFRFHFHGWEFTPRPATILTKHKKWNFHFTQTPDFDDNIKPHSSQIWSNTRQNKTQRETSFNTKNEKRPFLQWFSRPNLNKKKHETIMKMPDSRWTRRSINISTTRPSQKRDKTKYIYLQYPSKSKHISTCKQEKSTKTFIFKWAEDSQTSPMLIGKVPKSSSRLVVLQSYPQGEE